MKLRACCLLPVLLLAGCDGKAPPQGGHAEGPLVAASGGSAALDPDRLPVTAAEQAFIAAERCRPPCDHQAFWRLATARYPAIARIPLPRHDLIEASDPAARQLQLDQFRAGLFYAARIRLADGRTLFALESSCAKGWTSTDAAIGDPGDGKGLTVWLQYYPVFRRARDHRPVEMKVLLRRRGDRLDATGNGFAHDLLYRADYLQRHGLVCWHGGTTGPDK